jgi:hypothetical protein
MGYPVVIMDWIDGKGLDWKIIKQRPDVKQKVLAQLANYIFDLTTLTESREALENLKELQLNGTFLTDTLTLQVRHL